jgi:glycosyltransferase A (GT-A) superfamily protein (DUF2064 family)
MRPAALVMAKAPVPGRVKTRLAATVGDDAAAALAYAALLDTLDACEVLGPERCYLALADDLGEVDPPLALMRRAGVDDTVPLTERLAAWTVVPQHGDGLGERIARAHADVHAAVGGGPVVQVGMDTPHVDPATLLEVAEVSLSPRPVLGPADDGGWWVLASTTADDVRGLGSVPMSSPDTGAATLAMLRRAGHDVAIARAMRDVDQHEDAEHVARQAPTTRFARVWRALSEERPS